VDRLKKGRSLDDLQLGKLADRFDLTELPGSPTRGSARGAVGGLLVEQVHGLVEIRRRTLSRIDFTRAKLNGWRLRDCEILDCKFDRGHCSEWILWNSTVRECTFSGTDLRGGMLGTYPEGGRVKWQRVSFVDADMRSASAYGAIFEDCDFSNARLDEVNFHQCDFVRCRFAGNMEEVFFDGRRLPDRAVAHEMDSVDFQNAHFVSVDFRGYSLQNTMLPRDPDVFPIRHFPCVARRVIEVLTHEKSESARLVRGMLENALPWTESRPDSVWVFNRRDWREWGGREAELLAERCMKTAEAECFG